MTPSITILSQPTCQPCRFIEKRLTAAGTPYEKRDVHADPAAADLLIGIYQRLKPGQHPSTPVTLIGDEIVFGPLVLERLREMRLEEAA